MAKYLNNMAEYSTVGAFAPEDIKEFDQHVASRIHTLRRELGFTQKDLANIIGLSYQQIQKYESGVNRISAGFLYCLGASMGVSPEYFYQGLSELEKGKSQDSVKLNATLSTIDDNVRESVIEFLEALAHAKKE